MRVALLCHYPDDATAPAGGVWAVGRNLAAGLVAAGAEVHVVRYVAVAGLAKPRVTVGGSLPLLVHTVQLGRRWTQPIRRVAAVPVLESVLRELRPDAITAHESEYGLAALRSGFPTAVTIHGIPRQEFRSFSEWQRRLDMAFTLWQDWLMVRRVRHIVAINDYAMAQYRHRTRAQFHVIPVPIGSVFFAALERDPVPNTILMVGGMSERKDPIALLQAVALLRSHIPGVELHIAGRLPSGAFGQKVQDTIAQQGLVEHVRWLGPLNQPELAQAYTACAVTALSSRQETAPAVLMEAMAARRPVVAVDVGGVGEIVAHNVSGLVVPAGDIPGLAQALEQILADPPLAESMGQRGRVLAEERYRREVVGQEYLALLRRIAAGS